MVLVLPEDSHVDQEMADGEKLAGSGGALSEVTLEPSMASPRLIPVPDSPTSSGRSDPPPTLGDTGNSSASRGRKCAPSQVPECESVMTDCMTASLMTNCVIFVNCVGIERRTPRWCLRRARRPWMQWLGKH